ncbi:MAG: class I SAM-dependent methyltransferase [Cyanothece sp. SIO2G6]|nr:class I SAM-dependent methyltransferase [Cyanothece sp. SIO2G6]
MGQPNYYDRIASIYDQTRWMTDAAAAAIADYILDWVNATPNTSFLEPGVGTGLNVMPLVQRGYPVTGMDISQEMLDQFRHKLPSLPSNLTLIQGDASQLPFADASFDVVLTVHMIHTVAQWQSFLDGIERVLKPGGFYLNAQWRVPPARQRFQDQFFEILAGYEGAYTAYPADKLIGAIAIDEYFRNKGYRSDYQLVQEWTVSNTVQELLESYRSRAYGFCWRVSDAVFHTVMDKFETFCLKHYGSLDRVLSSPATFELWAYTPD